MALNARSPSPSIGTSSSVQPSEFIQRHRQSISGTFEEDDDVNDPDPIVPVVPVQEGDNVVLEVEDELSEQQLRELYDSEEIDRFLNLFSAVGNKFLNLSVLVVYIVLSMSQKCAFQTAPILQRGKGNRQMMC